MPAPLITSGLFAVDDHGALTLLGGASPSSGLVHFPRREVCPFTGADDIVEVDLPRGGRLMWWTTVHVAPPGYTGPVPYGLGVVALDLTPELRVVGRIIGDEGSLTAGRQMTVVAEEIETPDGLRTTWAFS